MLASIEGIPIVGVRIGPSSRYAERPPQDFERFKHVSSHLTRFCVGGVMTHGKFMHWSFADVAGWFDISMLVTHGMSGRWLICGHADVQALKHVVIAIDLADGRSAVFVDPRHFGTIRFGRARDVRDVIDRLGDDVRHLSVMQTSVFVNTLLMKARSKTICEALMDQSVLAGIGNYLKAEVLWKAKMSPWRVVRDITSTEFTGLMCAIIDTYEIAVRARGASFKTHLNPDGSPGQMVDFMQVYGKELDPNGLAVVRQKTPDGRTTWWVPGLQS